MAAHARAKPRPVLLTGVGAVTRVWRGWQRSRPFLGALIAVAGGTELMVVSLSAPGHAARVIVPVGTLIAGGMLACALLLLFDPAQRSVYATAAILLAATALTTSHLGGYLAGTVLAATGGAVAFAWVPQVPAGRRVRAPIPGFTLIRGEGSGLHPVPVARPDLVVTGPDLAVTRPDLGAIRPDLGRSGPAPSLRRADRPPVRHRAR